MKVNCIKDKDALYETEFNSFCSNNINDCKTVRKTLMASGKKVFDLVSPATDKKMDNLLREGKGIDTKVKRHYFSQLNLAKKYKKDSKWWAKWDTFVFTPCCVELIKAEVKTLSCTLYPDITDYDIGKKELTALKSEVINIYFDGELGKKPFRSIEYFNRMNPELLAKKLGFDDDTKMMRKIPPQFRDAFTKNLSESSKKRHYFKFFIMKDLQ